MSNDNKLREDLDLLDVLFRGYQPSMARSEGLAAVARIKSALPAEKPAAAAERGAVGLTVWKGDVAELAVQHGIYNDPVEEDVQAFAKAVLAAATINATPPDQAAEPAQVDEVAHPIQPLVVAKDGCTRFKKNPIVNYLYEWALPRGMGMNELHCLSEIAGFTDQDWQQFAQLIGYSLSGYGELSYVDDAAWDRANALTQRPAAPLATDAGVPCDHDWQVHAGSGIEVCTKCKRGRVGADGPTSGTAQASDDTSEYFRGWNAGYRNGLRAAGPDPMDEDAVRAADTINGATVDTTSANYRRLNVAAHPAAVEMQKDK